MGQAQQLSTRILGYVSMLPNPRNPVLWAAAWHVKPAAEPRVMVYMSNFTAFRCGQGFFYYATNKINHEDHRFIECGSGININWPVQPNCVPVSASARS